MANISKPLVRVHCNSCKLKTEHDIVGTAQDHGYDEDDGYQWKTDYQMLQCAGCRDVVLKRSFWFSENEGVEVSYFPPPTSRHLSTWRWSLPKQQRLLLEEIYRSFDSENVRLPMMGARALIDVLILDKVGDKGSFQEKLKALVAEGYLSARNEEALYAALDVGSAAAHRGYAASGMHMDSVMDIVENLLQAVYVLPESGKRLKDSTPPRPPKK